MKKIILLLLVAGAVFSSCENVESNGQAFQGQINENFFRAADSRAYINDDGSRDLVGLSLDENLTIHIGNSSLTTHEFGGLSNNYANFTDASGSLYTTRPNGSGQVIISRICISCGEVSGNFKFTAIREGGGDTITVSKGLFFKIPIDGGPLVAGEDPTSDGEMIASVDGNSFTAGTVVASKSGGKIAVSGGVGDQIIKLEVPEDVEFGVYDLPQDGFEASYTDENGETQAMAGRITVNVNNAQIRAIRMTFRFNTGDHVITSGDVRADY